MLGEALDLIKIEEDVLKYWKEKEIMKKVREKNRGKRPFYFLDGPPFVSGDLHPGQMWVKTMKDAFLRYRRMRGYDVYDRAGYDVHGLPVETRAEASLNVKSKKEIEQLGLEKFINTCRAYVESYIGKMDADYERFGMSLDFSDPYLPYKNSYIETEWSLFKKLWEKGFVYEEKKVVPYCTRCGTALSQGSMEVVYQNDSDPSIFVAFKLLDSKKASIKNAYLLVWTTTPWTLPANIAIAVNPEILYVLAKIGERRYVLAKDRLDAVAKELNESPVVEEEFYGSELVGSTYQGLLEDKVPKQKELAKYHKVIPAKEVVSSEEGSGLVHIAPGHGLDDYLLGKKYKLPIFSPIDKEGRYTEDAGAFKGLKVPEEANEKVLEALRQEGSLIAMGSITHSYPHCWRCNTKLIYIATDQWFVNIQKIKKKLISENRKVIWHPEEARQWQEDFLESSPDWTISRQRYWGAPMPIWRNGDEIEVIGSLQELREKAENKEEVDRLTDLHRPYIDKIVLKGKSGKPLYRIPDVFDVWLDSAIAFRASLTDEQFDKLFPIDFVLEAIEQLRGWFAYQLKVGVMLYGKRPFKHVVTHGMMLGEDGREMHKHLGNYVSLQDILKQQPADAFRLWCLSHNPRLDLIFRMKDIEEASKVVLLLYNIANLLKEYSSAIGYKPEKVRAPRAESLEDIWLVSRLNKVIKQVTGSLENYDAYSAAKLLRSFLLEDFSRFYLKLAKKRMGEGKKEAKKKIDLINYALYNTLLLFAPMMPFATEKVYQDLYAFKESIFLEDWPKCKAKYINEDVEREFEYAKDALAALLSGREKAGIKLRQPLEHASLAVDSDEAFAALERLAYAIEELSNIKSIKVEKVATLSTKRLVPNYAKIGPAFKEKTQAVANAIKAANADEVEEAIAASGYYVLQTEKGPVNITQEHFSVVSEQAAEGIGFKHGLAKISTEISEKAKEEAMVREIERRIQLARKQAALSKADRIEIEISTTPAIEELIKRYMETIKRNVNAKQLRFGQAEGGIEASIENTPIRLAIKKIEK